MVYPPFWLWLIAVSLTLDGLLLSRFPSVDRFIARLPLWFCALLVLAGLVGIWLLFHAQFGGLSVPVSLPGFLTGRR